MCVDFLFDAFKFHTVYRVSRDCNYRFFLLLLPLNRIQPKSVIEQRNFSVSATGSGLDRDVWYLGNNNTNKEGPVTPREMKISIIFPFIFSSFAHISFRPFVRRPFRKTIRRRWTTAYLHDKLRKTMNTISFVGYGNETIRHHAQGHCYNLLGHF